MKIKNLFLILMAIFFLSACGSEDNSSADEGEGSTNWFGNEPVSGDSSDTSDDPLQSDILTGAVTDSDPSVYVSNVGVNAQYDSYDFEGTSGQTVTVSYEFSRTGWLIYLCKTDDIDTSSDPDSINELIGGDVGLGSTSGEFSRTLSESTSYSIAILASFDSGEEDLDYTVTWALSD